MEKLKGDDAQEIAEDLFTALVDLAMGLDAIDMADLIANTRNGNLREAFLAGAEFSSSMGPVLERRRAMN